MKAVEINNLTKNFGATIALRGITFSVDVGDIYGLIGPNGAGKTTTFRIIAGLIPPTSGSIKVFGLNPLIDTEKIKNIISYLPEDAGTYRNITGYEFLKLVSEIYFSNKEEAEEALEIGIRIANIGNRIYDKMKTYSKGMKRRIQVARVLMVRPKLAILDEPTSGLDVIHAREVRRVINNVSREFGTTILLSSHNMLEVQDICQKVALIHQGRILVEGLITDLLEEYSASNLEELFVSLVRGVAR